MREDLQLDDRALMLGSFLDHFIKSLRFVPHKATTAISFLFCSIVVVTLTVICGYGWIWPGAISLLLESYFSLTLPSKHQPACFYYL